MHVTPSKWVLCLAAILVFGRPPAALASSDPASHQYDVIAAQLRTLGVALHTYQRDHNGLLPPRLTDLVSGGYLPTGSLVSGADPTGGTQGGIPDTYPWSQYTETDEPGSSYLYEFSGAPCSWFVPHYLGDHPTAEDIDLDADGVVSWAEVKTWQLAHGDIIQTPTNHPYASNRFPVVRCFWLGYPVDWTGGTVPTVVNLAVDLQTVFVSSPKWERDQVIGAVAQTTATSGRSGGRHVAASTNHDAASFLAPKATRESVAVSPTTEAPRLPILPAAATPARARSGTLPGPSRTDDPYAVPPAPAAPSSDSSVDQTAPDAEDQNPELPADEAPEAPPTRRALPALASRPAAGSDAITDPVREPIPAVTNATTRATPISPVVWCLGSLAALIVLGLFAWGVVILRRALIKRDGDTGR